MISNLKKTRIFYATKGVSKEFYYKQLKAIYQVAILIIIGFLSLGCTEEIQIEDQSYENILVMEATLTDEFKNQTIELSRTTPLIENNLELEMGANVSVSEGNTIYTFTQSGNGTYTSDIEFAAKENFDYQLIVNTKDGKNYRSSIAKMAATAELVNVFAEAGFSNNKYGAKIFVNSKSNDNSVTYFKYEFEETYKIIVPQFTDIEGEITNYDPYPMGDPTCPTYDIVITKKEVDNSICYGENSSQGIIQAATSSTTDNLITRVPIHFIKSTDPVLRDRYSILVKQYSQSPDAFNFYKIINDLGSPESLLSESQPGYVAGNISGQNDSQEKVLGFFEIASYTEKRIYFNYFDLDFTRPEYYEKDCVVNEYDYTNCDPQAELGSRKLFTKVNVSFYNFVFALPSQDLYYIAKSR